MAIDSSEHAEDVRLKVQEVNHYCKSQFVGKIVGEDSVCTNNRNKNYSVAHQVCSTIGHYRRCKLRWTGHFSINFVFQWGGIPLLKDRLL